MFQRHTFLPSSEITLRISHSNHHSQTLWLSEVSQQYLQSNQPNAITGSHHTMGEFKIWISCVIVFRHQNKWSILETVKITQHFHIIITYFPWISNTRNFQKIRQYDVSCAVASSDHRFHHVTGTCWLSCVIIQQLQGTVSISHHLLKTWINVDVCNVKQFMKVKGITPMDIHHLLVKMCGTYKMSRKQVWICCNTFDDNRTDASQEHPIQMTMYVVQMTSSEKRDVKANCHHLRSRHFTGYCT